MQPDAADKIGVLQFGQQARQVRRIILAIAIERSKDGRGGGLNAGPDGRALPEILAMPEAAHVGVCLLGLLNAGRRLVLAGVIHKNQFVLVRQTAHDRVYFLTQRENVLFFVVNRNKDSNIGRHGSAMAKYFTDDKTEIASSVSCGRGREISGLVRGGLAVSP